MEWILKLTNGDYFEENCDFIELRILLTETYDKYIF